MRVEAFFDAPTASFTYVVDGGPGTPCAVIDPVLDFDIKSGRTGTLGLDKVVAFIAAQRLSVAWILETHVHADHLTAAPLLKARTGGEIAIGRGVAEVQRNFAAIFNLPTEAGAEFDRLLGDGDRLACGALELTAMATPGHTPSCMTYRVGDAAFVGDTMFMPDGGTARCDFPGGDAATLYRSIRRILALPEETRLFVCHDYCPGGRALAWESSVAAQRAGNIHVHDGVAEPDFVAMRTQRDATLALPALLLPAVQVNMRAGRLPPSEANGVAYLKLPVNRL